ncbi:hypothetical protein AHAS_Ahas15G0086700 [Arachis hypogaea]
MVVGLREGWTGSSVVVYGHLFVVSELERMKLKVYDTETDSWDAIDGPPLPEQICKPFAINACDCHIYVVGRNFHVAVGHISRLLPDENSDKKWSFSVRWHVIDAPESLSDLTPSSSHVLTGSAEFAASGFGEKGIKVCLEGVGEKRRRFGVKGLICPLFKSPSHVAARNGQVSTTGATSPFSVRTNEVTLTDE